MLLFKSPALLQDFYVIIFSACLLLAYSYHFIVAVITIL